MEGHILDKAGCEYGRTTKERLQCLQQETEVLKYKYVLLEKEISEIKKQFDDLFQDFSDLKTKFAWLVGSLSVLGSLGGSLLSALIKHLFGSS